MIGPQIETNKAADVVTKVSHPWHVHDKLAWSMLSFLPKYQYGNR